MVIEGQPKPKSVRMRGCRIPTGTYKDLRKKTGPDDKRHQNFTASAMKQLAKASSTTHIQPPAVGDDMDGVMRDMYGDEDDCTQENHDFNSQQYELPYDDYVAPSADGFDDYDDDLEDAAYLDDDEAAEGVPEYHDDDDPEEREMLSMLQKIAMNGIGNADQEEDDDDDSDFVDEEIGGAEGEEEDDPQLAEHADRPIPRVYLVNRHNRYMGETGNSGVDSTKRGKELLQRRRESALPEDDHIPLYNGCGMTMGECAREVLSNLSDLKSTPSEDHITRALKTMSLLVPKGETFPFKPIPGKSLKKTISSYSKTHNHKLYLEFEVCFDGCYVFGEKGKGPNATLQSCPVCNADRYTRSSTGDMTETARKTLHYRPLIPLVESLLGNEMFVRSMNYETLETVKDGVIYDLLSGKEIKHQIQKMKELFEETIINGPRSVNGIDSADIEMMNMVLGEFWDGAQVHSTIVSTFYPTFISFHNLPPTMRGVLGVGTFLLALDTSNKPATRDFIFKRCLIPELQQLASGIVMKTAISSFFVQARLLLHGFDTKAFETMLGVQASTSKAACPMCTTTVGTYRIDHCVYIGNRGYLPHNNFLRSLGECGMDYPEGFFTAKDCPKFYDFHDPAITAHNLLQHGATRQPLSLKDIAFHNFSAKLTADADDVRAMLDSMPHLDNKQRMFTHDSFAIDYNLVKRTLSALRYQYADFRKLVHEKATHDYYMFNAMVYCQTCDKKKGNKKVAAINGANGVYHGIPLRYLNIAMHFNFDPFHAFQGLAKLLIQNISGERNYSKKQATETRCHDHANLNVEPKQTVVNEAKKAAAPPAKIMRKRRVKVSEAYWVFTQRQQNKCDVFVECMRIPVGAADHFEVKKLPFKRAGYLKGIARIQFIAYVLPTFMSTLANKEYPDAYKAYFEIAAMIMKGFLSPVFTETSIDQLWHKVALYLSIHEGIFPISECSFLSHELIDLPRFIAMYGPVRCWWALYGERAISRVKHFVPKGGQSFQNTTMEQYMLNEEKVTSDFYSSIDNLVGDRDFIQANMLEGQQRYAIRSKLFSCRLYKPYTSKQTVQIQKTACTITVFELTQLLEFCVLEIEDTFIAQAAMNPEGPQGLDLALQASSFYRIFYHYCKHIQTADEVNKPHQILGVDQFVLWLLRSDLVENKYKCLPKQNLPARSDLDGTRIRCLLDKGVVFDDFIPTLDEIRCLKVHLHRNAVLQGTRINTRGWECRETDQMSSRVGPTNDLNVLSTNWFTKSHYSSWCAVTPADRRRNMLSRDLRTIKRKFEHYLQPRRLALFAQTNAFITLNMRSDRFLDQQAFASVTCRKKMVGFKTKIDCSDLDSLVEDICFIPIQEIMPVRFGVVGYDVNNKPFHDCTKFFKDKSLYSDQDKTAAHNLVLCELDGANETLHGQLRKEVFKFSAVGAPPLIFELSVAEGFKGRRI